MQRVGVMLLVGALASEVTVRLGALVPGSLPALVHPLVPWPRRHIARVARRYDLGRDDLWDETVAALLRAAVYYDPAAGAFVPYARTAVHRACYRYVVRTHVFRTRHGASVSLEDAGERPELTAPSAEAEAIARDALRRAWLLREHAALVSSRGDSDTTTRLLDAATAAATVARTTRPRTVRA
jgi:DNA-directed RNA polymerase specialized sigma24 family protein